MIFAGLGSPIGRAVGMGFDAPVTEADFDQLENFYYSRQAPAQLDYCPLTDSSLLEIARKRGYGIAELNNVLARKLDPAETFPPGPTGFTIRPGRPEEALAFSAIVRQSFFPDGGEPAGFDEMLAPMFAFPGAITFVAEADVAEGAFTKDASLVATGAGLIIPEHKIVGLYEPLRLSHIEAAACKPPSCGEDCKSQPKPDASTPSSSPKVARRRCAMPSDLGFTLAYSKATLIKPPSG